MKTQTSPQNTFTIGPWEVQSLANENQMGQELFVIPAGMADDWIAQIAGHGPYRANAALVAAAPELLSALEELLAWANLDHSTNRNTISLREACKEVIAKAKGAQS